MRPPNTEPDYPSARAALGPQIPGAVRAVDEACCPRAELTDPGAESRWESEGGAPRHPVSIFRRAT